MGIRPRTIIPCSPNHARQAPSRKRRSGRAAPSLANLAKQKRSRKPAWGETAARLETLRRGQNGPVVRALTRRVGGLKALIIRLSNRFVSIDSNFALDGAHRPRESDSCATPRHPPLNASSFLFSSGRTPPAIWRATTFFPLNRACSMTPRSCANGAASAVLGGGGSIRMRRPATRGWRWASGWRGRFGAAMLCDLAKVQSTRPDRGGTQTAGVYRVCPMPEADAGRQSGRSVII